MVLNLKKNEPLNLTKEPTTASLTKVVIGAGWDAAHNGPAIDLDLVVSTDTKEVCYFNNLSILDGAVKHHGDNRTGEGDGADEEVIVDLAAIPASVNELTFAIGSFTGQNFDQIENEFIQIADQDGKVLAKSEDDISGSGKTLVLGKLTRANGEWSVVTLNEMKAEGFSEYANSLAA